MRRLGVWIIALIIWGVYFYALDFALMRAQGLKVGTNLFPLQETNVPGSEPEPRKAEAAKETESEAVRLSSPKTEKSSGSSGGEEGTGVIEGAAVTEAAAPEESAANRFTTFKTVYGTVKVELWGKAKEGDAGGETPSAEAKVAAPETKDKAAPRTKTSPAPKLKADDYPRYQGFNNRVSVWIIAQLHLFFAAFVLAVPMFVLVIEGIGMATRDPRYDKIAYEFIRISTTAFSLTSLSGGVLAFFLLLFYPDFFKYLSQVFGPSMVAYAILFVCESVSFYIYYYSWHSLHDGFQKWVHLTLGLLLNAFGATLMVISNSWTSFMMSPAGVDEAGALVGTVWDALRNPLWNPLNLHRVLANVAYGGAIVAAYAAFRFLSTREPKERAHYDWMGYTSNIIAISALIPLPFAGYWLMAEVYAYSQQMGITAMGGILAWLFIIQAVLIGSLFLGANYYLWSGMNRIPGSERYTPYIKYIVIVMVLCFLVWITPHTIVMTPAEVKAIGGSHHPKLGAFGIMPAKNTAANLMITSTFLSFLLYRRSSKVATAAWAETGNILQIALFAVAGINIICAGIYGYLVPTVFKVGASVPQVGSTLSVVVLSLIIHGLMFRKARLTGPIEWGRMTARSQYALFLLAISFTWLMGLMGYIRSSLRQHWHVYAVMKDASPDAFIPTIGYAATVVTAVTLIFMGLVIFIFWLSQLGTKPAAAAPTVQWGAGPAPTFAKTTLFSVAVILFYTFFARSLPQLVNKPPETEVDVSSMTTEEFIALGKTIFTNEDLCWLCHGTGGKRAPIIENLQVKYKERISDPRYKGKAKTAEEYIRESMLTPSMYVVEGYGKKGTDDTVSPMPPADKPPLSLGPVQFEAVIAFLETKDGGPLTVGIPKGDLAGGEKGNEKAAVAKTPEEAIRKYGCGKCHRVLDFEGEPDEPDLTDVGARMNEAYIRRSILDPNAELAKGFEDQEDVMPKSFGRRMTVTEYEMIVEFLKNSKGAPKRAMKEK